MTYGTGPSAVQQILWDNWQATRSGRPDVPDLVRDGNGDPSNDPQDADAPGELLVLKNREEVATNRAVVDTIHVYHPSESFGTWEDAGAQWEDVTENVQVDIDLTNRTDPATGERVTARERMVGDRDAASFDGEDAPYPGILGEVKYCFELVRKQYEEYDRVSVTPLGGTLENSDATVRLDVTLEILAKETVR